MRTSADEVSIHALSPESTFAASSARASEARTHQYPAPKDRCLPSIVPPEVEEIDEQRWCHDPLQGVNREPPGHERGTKGTAAQFPGTAYFLCSVSRGSVPARSRRKLSRCRSAMKAVMTRDAARTGAG